MLGWHWHICREQHPPAIHVLLSAGPRSQSLAPVPVSTMHTTQAPPAAAWIETVAMLVVSQLLVTDLPLPYHTCKHHCKPLHHCPQQGMLRRGCRGEQALRTPTGSCASSPGMWQRAPSSSPRRGAPSPPWTATSTASSRARTWPPTASCTKPCCRTPRQRSKS